LPKQHNLAVWCMKGAIFGPALRVYPCCHAIKSYRTAIVHSVNVLPHDNTILCYFAS
jgi:hypothetical protein